MNIRVTLLVLCLALIGCERELSHEQQVQRLNRMMSNRESAINEANNLLEMHPFDMREVCENRYQAFHESMRVLNALSDSSNAVSLGFPPNRVGAMGDSLIEDAVQFGRLCTNSQVANELSLEWIGTIAMLRHSTHPR